MRAKYFFAGSVVILLAWGLDVRERGRRKGDWEKYLVLPLS
jgi:hypothetical protein